MAVRLMDGTLVGYSAICTHLACAVLWRADRGPEESSSARATRASSTSARGGDGGPSAAPAAEGDRRRGRRRCRLGAGHRAVGETDRDAWCRQFAERDPERAELLECPGVSASRTRAGTRDAGVPRWGARNGGPSSPTARRPGSAAPGTSSPGGRDKRTGEGT
ncbi:hypothetical protein ACFQ60_22165 [Streptomyces zhihengii]